MIFKDVPIGGRFKFAWSGYRGVKVSARCYTLDKDISDAKQFASDVRRTPDVTYEVGTIKVEVTAEED